MLIASAGAFGATTLGIGATTSPWVAGALLGTFGLALTTWNVVVVSLRQAIVPDQLVGRINSTFQLLSMGMLPLGPPWAASLAAPSVCAPHSLSPALALLVMALVAIPVVTTRAIEAARAAA